MVKVVVKIPEKLSEKQKKVLKEFIEIGEDKVKTTKGFFEKMKEYI